MLRSSARIGEQTETVCGLGRQVSTRPDRTRAAGNGEAGEARGLLKITYRHTNLVARDWKRLAAFYETVFACEPVPPKRDLSGEWLDRATGVEGARIRGVHLRLPGHGRNGPTLEVFQYDRSKDAPPARADRLGFGHVAFEVEDVREALRRVVAHGGAEVAG